MSKIKFLVFSSDHCNIKNIFFDNEVIHRLECEYHLGAYIGKNYNAVYIEKCITQFICQVNYMNSVFKYANCEVKRNCFIHNVCHVMVVFYRILIVMNLQVYVANGDNL